MPPTDIIKPGHITDLLVYLRTIAASAERIADALEAANANDPIAALGKALEAEAQATPQHERDVRPPEWMLR